MMINCPWTARVFYRKFLLNNSFWQQESNDTSLFNSCSISKLGAASFYTVIGHLANFMGWKLWRLQTEARLQGSQRDTERLGLSPGPRPHSQGSAFPSVLSDSAPQHSSAPSWLVQFSCSVVSDSLQPHGPQHARPACPSPTPGAYSTSCPLSWWCHPTISSSVIPFSSSPQSFPASGSFQMSQLFASGGQRIGVSASASVLPMNIQDWFPLRRTGWISLLSKGLSRVFSNTTVQKHQCFSVQLSL